MEKTFSPTGTVVQVITIRRVEASEDKGQPEYNEVGISGSRVYTANTGDILSVPLLISLKDIDMPIEEKLAIQTIMEFSLSQLTLK